MQDDLLLQVSSTIREIRKKNDITIQQLADKAKVSKGLISQIENNRSIPSLPVLMSIIQSLNVDVNDFFKDIRLNTKAPAKTEVKRHEEYRIFEKEPTKEFIYKRIFTRNLKGIPIDIILLELEEGAKREQLVTTAAFEYKYIIKGTVEYLIHGKKHILHEGDSLFFDGRQPHKPANVGAGKALILVIYFFMTDEMK